MDTIEQRTPAEIAATVSVRAVEIKKYDAKEYGRRNAQNRLTRITVFHEGESVGAQFALRRSRPQHVYRTLVPRIVEKANALLAAGGHPEIQPGYQADWSQKAGCWCGCSPGFIVSKSPAAHGFQIMATVSMVDHELTIEQAEEVAARAGRFDEIAAGAP